MAPTRAIQAATTAGQHRRRPTTTICRRDKTGLTPTRPARPDDEWCSQGQVLDLPLPPSPWTAHAGPGAGLPTARLARLGRTSGTLAARDPARSACCAALGQQLRGRCPRYRAALLQGRADRRGSRRARHAAPDRRFAGACAWRLFLARHAALPCTDRLAGRRLHAHEAGRPCATHTDDRADHPERLSAFHRHPPGHHDGRQHRGPQLREL